MGIKYFYVGGGQWRVVRTGKYLNTVIIKSVV